MKSLATVLFALLSVLVFAAVTTAEDPVCSSGICVVEFNARFNESNTVPWIESLEDCTTSRVDIESSPELQRKHKIVVVPTIIVFNEGEEVTRFQANIMMSMEASQEDVQDAVDEVMLNDF